MAYCTTDDLLLGQLENRLPPEIDLEQYMEIVADEIEARLGFMYVVPFITEGAGALPDYQIKLLKSINSKRASGRVIMAATVATQDNLVHQYALRLMQEADLELHAITCGDVRLAAPSVGSDGAPLEPTPDPDALDPFARVPGAIVRDEFSAVLAFEQNIYQGDDVNWAPNDGQRYYPVPVKRSGG